jgi:ATPase subunit of ABC transporter with duplicated ATPase domains
MYNATDFSEIAFFGSGTGKSTLLKILVGELELPHNCREEREGEGGWGRGGGGVEQEGGGKEGGAGERERERGGKVVHRNLRVAYIAQHSMRHLEQDLNLTPVEYIQRRFFKGRDRETQELVTVCVSICMYM